MTSPHVSYAHGIAMALCCPTRTQALTGSSECSTCNYNFAKHGLRRTSSQILSIQMRAPLATRPASTSCLTPLAPRTFSYNMLVCCDLRTLESACPQTPARLLVRLVHVAYAVSQGVCLMYSQHNRLYTRAHEHTHTHRR